METVQILKMLAALMFGTAVLMFGLVAYRLIAGGATRTAGIMSLRREDMRRRALRRSPVFRMSLPLITVMAGTVGRLGLDPIRNYLQEPYVRAGYPGGLDDDELVAVAVLMAMLFTLIILMIALTLFGPGWVWLALLGPPMGVVAVASHLKSVASERETAILQSMPYVLDLMVLMLRSGTSLRIALQRVVADFDEHPLGVELGQVLAEIDVGASRADSFRKMAERLKIQDLTALVDAIVQSEELGWPLAETLERLADRLSSERQLRAQAAAGAAGVYVMLPSTLVLLSAVILLFSPIIVRFMRGGLLDGQ